jgi:fatty-acid desaturase
VSDEAFSLAMALTCIALLLVLYHRWRAHRALKKLQRLLEESEKPKS